MIGSETYQQHLNDLFILSDFHEDIPKLEESNTKRKKKNDSYIRGPYKKYSQEIKQEAVEKLRKSNMNYKTVSQELKINKKNLIRWAKKAENNWSGRKAGRKAFDINMEVALTEWIKKQTKLTNKEIRRKALELSTLKNFKASKGWLWKFVRRQDLKSSIKNLINSQ